MLIKIKDQISVSAIRAELLRPGEVIEVRDDLALSLLTSHPGAFARVEDGDHKLLFRGFGNAKVPIHSAAGYNFYYFIYLKTFQQKV